MHTDSFLQIHTLIPVSNILLPFKLGSETRIRYLFIKKEKQESHTYFMNQKLN